MNRHTRLEAAADQVGAVATGLWRLDGDMLRQVCFFGPRIDDQAGQAFANATFALPLLNLELGIVRAAVLKTPTLMIASELPADVGSGYWLRRFPAACSLAIPIPGGVVSVALPEVPASTYEVVKILVAGVDPEFAG